ncbi:RagB/SusD family nutrient uptake outer membrane protein [Bacteroides reticulotermitis]|uniref:RagB/SusD family nutrient uptake outer membrane protein n=1 Tax=Bacteroides reticulotermitis TaxID=1133319 RepID=UPI003A8C7D0C
MILNKILSWSKLPVMGMSLILLNTTSCIDYIDNVNPNEVTEEMMEVDNLKTGAFFSQMIRRVVIVNDGDKLDSDYQIAQNLSHDLYSGYIAATLGSTNHNGQYNFQEQWVNATFDYAYTGIMAPWQNIHKIATEQGLAEVDALATIVKVEGMHRVADSFGPIPYVTYGSSSLYNSMDKVYAQFFEELDNAIEVLGNYVNGNSNAKLMSDYDCVYAGNVAKWVKFANTLRLRLAIRVAYADAELAEKEALKSVQSPFGLIETKADRAELLHNMLEYHHPLHEIAYNFNSGDCRPGATIVSYMSGLKDPRVSSYFTAAADGKYHGVRIGITTSNMSNYQGDKISNLNIARASTPVVWMTAAESSFLRAEGALRGWAMGGTAKHFYEQGVRISFEENNAAGIDDYLADATSTPGAFTDNVGSDNYTFTSKVTPAWNESAGFESKLERIITQKWIAIYPDGPEGWSEYRRTGYPEVIPVVRNSSNGTINTTLQVRRLPYTRDEKINNADGVASGIAALGGQDNGGTKLWWDQRAR